MFTGIVQGTDRLASIRDTNGIRTFAIEFADRFTDNLAIGGSVAVDGVCLTATTIMSSSVVLFDVILQSLAVTTLANHVAGDLVNVERAAKDGAEIGGHPLSGHVDFSTDIESVEEIGGNKVLRVSLPQKYCRYVFTKGYIAVNGASLTVSECNKAEGWFEVWLIPETRRSTNIDIKEAGDRLNIEIERNTQVVVDTVRDAVSESLGELRPLLEAILNERGLTLDNFIKPLALLPSRH